MSSGAGKRNASGSGSAQPPQLSTGTLSRRGGKSGAKKGRQPADDAANEANAAAAAEGDMMDDSGGEGTTPEHEPPAAAAQSRSRASDVSKMQKEIADLKAR